MTAQEGKDSGLGSEEVRRRHILGKAIVVGVFSGLLASAFRVALESAEHWRIHTTGALHGAMGLLFALGLGAGGGALAVWLVARCAPHAAGSGIPWLKSVLSREADSEWKRMIPVKFLSGLAGIGGGLALGREGPTVQMGSGVGHVVAEIFLVRRGEGERQALISAGAGAGLAAAFNAPLAGVIFVLEELHGRFTPVMFVAAFLASISGDIVARLLTGEHPVFYFVADVPSAVSLAPWALLLGGLAGLGGVIFNRSLLACLKWRQRMQGLPPEAAGAILGLGVGLVGWLRPEATGSGTVLVQHALSGQIVLSFLPILVLLRFGLTMVSYSAGSAGGIFLPLLVLGALGGLGFSEGVRALMPGGLSVAQEVFVVLGMGALFTAIVRAPLTGIVLMVELTGTYRLMLPLLLSCLAAYGVAEWWRDRPIYDALRDHSRGISPRPDEDLR